jgi:hypothetical protein
MQAGNANEKMRPSRHRCLFSKPLLGKITRYATLEASNETAHGGPIDAAGIEVDAADVTLRSTASQRRATSRHHCAGGGPTGSWRPTPEVRPPRNGFRIAVVHTKFDEPRR